MSRFFLRKNFFKPKSGAGDGNPAHSAFRPRSRPAKLLSAVLAAFSSYSSAQFVFDSLLIAIRKVEREMGIEPTQRAWKARVLPLNYSRFSRNYFYVIISLLPRRVNCFIIVITAKAEAASPVAFSECRHRLLPGRRVLFAA